MVGTDSGKSLLFSALRVPADAPGQVHFPDSVDPVFYEQLTSERLVTRRKLGRAVRVWELVPGRRNEALDCTVYAEAALVMIAPDIRTKLAAFVERVNAAGEALRAGGGSLMAAPRAVGRRVFSRGIS